MTWPRLCTSVIFMRTAALCLLLLVVGCHKASSKLEGHWTGQSVRGVSNDEAQGATRFASETALDFKGDTVTVKTEYEKLSGHYRVVREDKTTIVLTTDEGDAEQTLVLEGDKTLVWAIEKDKKIVFAKQ